MSVGKAVISIKLDTTKFFGAGPREPAQKEDYPSVRLLLGLHGVQALHQAGEALLQAVDGVVLRVMAAEAAAQAAERVANELQVAGLGAEGRCR